MKFLPIVCMALLGNLSINAQEKEGKRVTITDQTIIKSQDGTKISRTQAMDSLKTGKYTFRQVNEELHLIPSQGRLKHIGSNIKMDTIRNQREAPEEPRRVSSLKGKPAPQFLFTDINGTTYTNESLKGKIVVVNFWFIQCAPCIKEMPSLNRLVSRYQNHEDVVFLAPTFNNGKAVSLFAEKTAFHYSLIPDIQNELISQFEVNSYPAHIIINREGVVTYANSGFVVSEEGKEDAMFSILAAEVEKALKG